MPAVTPGGWLCRDCLTRAAPSAGGGPRCPHCGSPRRLDLARTAGLTLAHVDCDAFYASVEKRDRPELKDRPLIIGGGVKRVAICASARLTSSIIRS